MAFQIEVPKGAASVVSYIPLSGNMEQTHKNRVTPMERKPERKLKLTVRNIEALQTRASPHTGCPDDASSNGGGCCETSIMASRKLTAIAFF